MLELYSNVRLERYIFVYSYLIRLILEELEKKGEIAYLSLSAKRPYNVRALELRMPSDSQESSWHVAWLDIKPVKTTFISNINTRNNE